MIKIGIFSRALEELEPQQKIRGPREKEAQRDTVRPLGRCKERKEMAREFNKAVRQQYGRAGVARGLLRR